MSSTKNPVCSKQTFLLTGHSHHNMTQHFSFLFKACRPIYYLPCFQSGAQDWKRGIKRGIFGYKEYLSSESPAIQFQRHGFTHGKANWKGRGEEDVFPSLKMATGLMLSCSLHCVSWLDSKRRGGTPPSSGDLSPGSFTCIFKPSSPNLQGDTKHTMDEQTDFEQRDKNLMLWTHFTDNSKRDPYPQTHHKTWNKSETRLAI